MKTILITLVVTALVLCTAIPASAITAIVNNNGGAGQAEDTLCVSFFVTDTIGNISPADSFYVMIFNPWGDSVYAAAYINTAPEIRVTTVGGRKLYRWMEDVADIDGPSPRSGTYAGIIVAVDTLDGPSSARLEQAFTFAFILEPTLAERVKIGDTCTGSDSTKIARAVWNAPHANHLSSGTFGRNLDAQVSGLGAGAGAYSYSLIVWDSTNHQVIPGVNIALRNANQSALIAVGRTDTQGAARFNIDAAQYTAIAVATGYLFDPLASINVGGSGQDTLYGHPFDPGAPSSPSLCRVYGNLHDLTGLAEVGAVVSASLPSGAVRSGARMVSPFAVTTTTDASGYFFLDLFPSESLVPSGAKYEVTITRKDGTILRQRLRIPSETSWRLEW
jgi:hypothetical protein